MTITEYIDSKNITIRELKENFQQVRHIDVDALHSKGCFNCGDTLNQHTYKGEPWTGAQYCWKCNSINLTIYSDRMGGNYTDTVLVFKEK